MITKMLTKLKVTLVIFCFLSVFPVNSTAKKIKLKANCKTLKCPATEDLTCVNVIYNKGRKSMAYNVIVFNKCEIGYITCHPGLKASIVPMRNCNHSSHKTKSNKRFKREIMKGVRRSKHIRNQRSYYGDRLSDSSKEDTKLAKSSFDYDRTNIKLIDKEKEKKYMDETSNENEDQENISDDRLSDYDKAQKISEEALTELQSKSRENDIKVQDDANDNEMKDKEKDLHEEDDLKENAQSIDDTGNNEDIIHMNSGDKNLEHNDGYYDYEYADQTEEIYDNEENNSTCPAKCASVDMMVCAHCGHGVYRTFMSVCHLRAFTCTHKDEKLYLVSRRPCMQSAPFLSNLPKHKGRLHDSTDTDRVLQFIRCRTEGRLGKDSKCIFDR